ncbi:MAG TPA: ankyrin repeat domain-containing protein, partial [Candidatus Babeliaceae bacterium]|nr:ankyrin repeat domain-containing protein [Candidatus Babeliaceae bacterium]
EGSLEGVQEALRKGADINFLSENRYFGEGKPETALNAAIVNHHTNIVKFLLDHGAKVTHLRPLYWAMTSSTPEIVDLLVQAGANPQEMTIENLCGKSFDITQCKRVYPLFFKHEQEISEQVKKLTPQLQPSVKNSNQAQTWTQKIVSYFWKPKQNGKTKS